MTKCNHITQELKNEMRKLKIKLESLKTETQELKLQQSKNKDCDRTYLFKKQI